MKDNSKIKLVIVDDHQMFGQSLAQILQEKYHFDVLWFSLSGQSLLERMVNSPKLPDIILMDISMKPQDGYDLREIIQTKYPNIKILAVTMNNTSEALHKILKSGFHGVVLKDEEISILVDSIQMVYSKGNYISQNIGNLLYEIVRQDATKIDNALTVRELEFIELCADIKEYTYKEIAEIMKISVRTVDGYRETLFSKLGVRRRTGLVTYYMQNIKK